MDLLQSAINEIKRDILSNKDFVRSILKDVRLTKENVDPNLIYSLMSEFSTNQQPPRPKSNAPKELATGKGIAKPIAMGDDSLESKVVADLLVGNNVYLYGKAGSGKAQPLYSKIATPGGWKTMGEIVKGDLVFSSDGKPTKVTGVFDRGVRDIYRVTFSDGSYADCCDEHLWAVYDYNHKSGKETKVMALKDFKDNILKKHGGGKYRIPISGPVEYKANKHIIHPYVLGVLLGDGGITSENITITTPDAYIIKKVSSLLPDTLELSKFKNLGNRCDSYCIRLKDKKTKINIYRQELARLGLMYKKSIDKCIPAEYLFDSIENRQQLLLGLNDTDGYVSGHSIEFSTSSEKLANDYIELIQSLGGTCRSTSRMPKYKDKKGQVAYGHVSYRLYPKVLNELQLFSLPKKKEKTKDRTKYFPSRVIYSVEFIGKLPAKCISVANESHLYLTDNYIVTHNTYAAKAIAASVMGQKIFPINCSQWTSPVQILGGQTIKGYQEGELIKAWAQGGIFIPDEMPKLDPNTAGLLNDALAETAAQPRYNDDGTVDEATIPYIVNGRGDKIYKGQDQPDEDLKFRFGVIATGNTDLITVGNKYAGNQKQDYSLVDRFAGSMYLLDYNPSTEMRLTYPYVYNIAIAMRKFLDARDSVQSISLRTMLNFNRTYEQEQLFKMNSPFADDIRDNLGNPIQPKSLDNSIDSFLEIMDKAKRNELMDDSDFRNARNSTDNNMDTFIAHFKARYHKDPITGEKVTVSLGDKKPKK